MEKHPLESLIEQYLSEKDITKNSFELYKIILKQYVAYLKENNIIYAKKTDVINYINLKKNENYSNNWLYLQISTIKAFYQYLSLNQKRLNLPEVLCFDITNSIKNVSKKTTLSKKVLTVEQAKQLLFYL
jgi:site-specific recombinase XerD